MLAALELATEKAGWARQYPWGEGQGFAITHTMGAYVAIVADVMVSRDSRPRPCCVQRELCGDAQAAPYAAVRRGESEVVVTWEGK
jgi:isoquinoline 1-oxidoreductase beta subunit